MEKAEIQALIREAFAAQKFAYVPYSRFHVGAALRGKSGQVFRGCNIENASYTPTNCAERTALFKAVSEGVREFDAIAIVGSKVGETNTLVTGPCGVCRQALYEFGGPELTSSWPEVRRLHRHDPRRPAALRLRPGKSGVKLLSLAPLEGSSRRSG
ncbi:MAG: cytidine deaminase [Gemmiger formicilis]|uniref:cytidine deaminase n=1 Tax=Gemmiger formicilis TaxID=745368 RepID=UPI003A2CC065